MNHPWDRVVRASQRVGLTHFVSRAAGEIACRWNGSRWRFASALALLLAAPLLAAAQGSAVRPRVTAQFDEGNLTTLRGNTHPLARPQFDQGAVPDSQPIRRMLLLLQRSPEQETSLKSLIDQQQTKTSPNFHKWLTPNEFGQQFGVAPADLQAVTNWLQSHGFQVARVSRGGQLIEFSGTAGQVRTAFHTEIHRYTINGQSRLANSSDPQIPTALAPVVAGPVSLHNFPRKPLSRVRGAFQKDKATGRVTPMPSPGFTFPETGCTSNPIFSSNCNALGPGDFAAIYDVNPLWSTGISGHVIDGTGQTIAVVGDSEICSANSPDFSLCTSDDISDFRTLFGLSTSNLPTVILDGPDPGFTGDETEGDLDVEWSGAIAKNATIDFVIAEGTEASAGPDLAAEYVVDNNLAPILSESFGTCEAQMLALGNLFEYSLWEQAAAQGITVIVATGDSGPAECDDPMTETVAVNGAGVSGIASTPFNVAVGGTDFDFTAANYEGTFWPNNNITVNGISFVSASSYIPETTWDDSCARTGPSGCASISTSIILFNIDSGGGGRSSCVGASVNSSTGIASCPPGLLTGQTTSGWNKPAYQVTASGSGLTAGNDLTRDVPDISLFASAGALSNSSYIFCESDIPGGQCSQSNGTVNFVTIGGTSAAAPTFAAIMALVNQNMVVNHGQPTGQGQGNANYVLYPLFTTQQQNTSISCDASSSPNSQCTFHDVTKGDNSVLCAGGSLQCSNAISGGFGIIETGTPPSTASYNAGKGFDLATGLGSVDAFNLVNNWASEVGSFTPTTTTLCLSTTQTGCASSSSPSSVSGSIVHGTTVYVSVGVTSTSGAPPASTLARAEDVALIGTFPSPPCTTNCVQGVDRFDANTGNVDIYPLGTGGVFSSSTKELVGGTYAIAARYAGDGKFGSSASTPGVSITITPENSAASISTLSINFLSNMVTTGSGPIPYGTLEGIRVDVRGSSSGLETGTGSVTLNDNGGAIVDPFGNPVTSFALNTEGYAEDQTSFLSVGSHSFTAQYGGDLSYNSSAVTPAFPFTVTAGLTTTLLTPSATSIATNSQVTLNAFVDTQSAANPSGGSLGASPSGTVTFFSGTTSLGSASLTAIPTGDVNGFDESEATLTVTLASSATITAQYGGDTNYSNSTSTGVAINVGGAGVNLSSGCGATITIGAIGQSGTCLINVSAANGFTGTVTLNASITGVPSGAVPPSCSSFGAPDQNFTAPNVITTSGSATMTCTTRVGARILPRPSSPTSDPTFRVVVTAMAVGAIFLILTIGKQRRWRLVPLAALITLVVLAGVSCSGGGSGNPGNSGLATTPGTYTVAVTATPQNASAVTTTVTVNVQ